MSTIWRVVCADGSVIEVIVEPYDDEVPTQFWKAYRQGWSGYMVALTERAAATKVAGYNVGDAPGALEILAPGEVSRSGLLAEVERLRADVIRYSDGVASAERGIAVQDEEIAALRAENARLTRACVEGLPREVLACPSCGEKHLEGPRHDDPNIDGRVRPHHTHRCYRCGHVWDVGRWSYGAESQSVAVPVSVHESTVDMLAAEIRTMCGERDFHQHKAEEWEESAEIERARAEAAEAECVRLCAESARISQLLNDARNDAVLLADENTDLRSGVDTVSGDNADLTAENEALAAECDSMRARFVTVCETQAEMLDKAGDRDGAKGARLCATVLRLLTMVPTSDPSPAG